ncbi:MAG TPA: sulfotransferase [Acetobacteraceae bacterium]|nr:sulfotransferase [Acetobacteraceae bacterium]
MRLAGRVDVLTRQSMSGWVGDRDGERTAIPLLVLLGGREYARLTVGAAAGTIAGGRELVRIGFDHDFRPPLSLYSPNRLEVRFAETGEPVPGGTRSFPAIQVQIAPPPSPLAPLLLTALGRSGTTLMMSRLAEHPRIVVARTYPYEVKLLAYYSAAFRTLVASADRRNSSEPGPMTRPRHRFFIGHNPFNAPNLFNVASDPATLATFFDETVPARFAATFRELLLDYYGILQRDQGKAEACYFAEKTAVDEVSRRGPGVFFPDVREVVLVRDPRDVLCSRKAFWKDDARTAIANLRAQLASLIHIRKQSHGHRTFVRYEDLVHRPEQTLAPVWEMLRLDPPTTVERAVADSEGDGAMFRRHATSGSPAASIGRWSRDLSAEEIAACREAFAPFLDAFGYAEAPEAVGRDTAA